ncbi:recombinase family protein [Mesorhizobium sp. M0898]|uniref:recombinase family protein n=1 Tax=Mesorhizobium sp. M0898 TaxID=2957020 RepID=UPI0033361AC0
MPGERLGLKAIAVRGCKPGWAEAIGHVRDGDTLTVWKLDPLGRSMKHLIEIITGLEPKAPRFRSSGRFRRRSHHLRCRRLAPASR